jgi:CDP-glycerol glycerophosphotransferase
MPRFSVIVPAYRVQGHLRDCLASVLAQSHRDLELIVVDDASPDACRAIAEESALADPRVIPVQLPETFGAGRARAAGAAQAQGDYLVFLDGDDLMEPGLLESLDGELARTGDPDLVLFDHLLQDHWGDVTWSEKGAVLRSLAGKTSTALQTPAVLTLHPAPWNRAVRRDFHKKHLLDQGEDHYAALTAAYRGLLLAETVTTVDRVGVRHRRRRGGDFGGTPGQAHFSVFGQYADLFDFLDTHPGLEPLRTRLFRLAVNHWLRMLADPGRVPEDLRGAFLKEAAVAYRTLRPAGFKPPGGVAGARFRAVAAGSPAVFRTLHGISDLTRCLGDRWEQGRESWREKVRRLDYRLQRARPLDPDLVVYSAYWSRGVSCNPAAIFHKAQELAPHLRGVWVVYPWARHNIPDGVDHVIEGSKEYWRLMARAKYLVNNASFPGPVVKRPGQVYLQTHHGTPLKKMGLDQRDYPACGNGVDFQGFLDHADQWDFSLSSNPHSAEVWERVYPSAFEDLPYGYPRNDVYFTATDGDVGRIRKELGIPEDKTAILYAPTHRDYSKDFTPLIDLERFCASIGPEFVVMVRAHYFYGDEAGLKKLQARGVIMDVSAHPRVEDLCLAADVLLADYSSLIFDYAALDRPVVLFAADWDAYQRSRGVYFDLLSGLPGETPGVVATNEYELAEVFRSGRWDNSHADRLRAAFRDRFCGRDDGRAAERVVRRVFLDEKPELPSGGAPYGAGVAVPPARVNTASMV